MVTGKRMVLQAGGWVRCKPAAPGSTFVVWTCLLKELKSLAACFTSGGSEFFPNEVFVSKPHATDPVPIPAADDDLHPIALPVVDFPQWLRRQG
jgi:hypothetical protein